ncbi:MAG: hypothetical protein ACRENU_01630 [Gemmatimonadaceae bacterium]
MPQDSSPRPTNIVLVGTLVATAAAVADVIRRGALEPHETGVFLLLFTLLFVIRVVGQVVVLRRAPAWLPPMEKWNLVPYHILLPSQVAILAFMSAVIFGFLHRLPLVVTRHVLFGRLLIYAALLYAVVMAVRYVVRMARQPAERWFGGAIPIVFHMVLASFLFAWGRYHVAR